MARQRINPEGTPDRVFQPVATPVNLYYQPNLSQVELNRTAQIIDAFKQFSPQLERFTSDIVAMGIQKERDIGAMEATQGPLDAANAKAAQAIEKAGGLAPWRYEAFLDTLGRRAVREKYQAWLYQNIDDLSALANPDGTPRDATYAQQKMAQAYQEQVASQFGAGSYFAARAAADEKFKIDSQFMPSIQARHAEKLKEQNLADAKDDMFAILSSHSTMSLLPTVDDGREDSFVKQQLKEVMEKYRRITGTSGAKPFTEALIEQANSQADAGDFDGALTTLRAFEPEDGKFKVIGIELGAAFGAQIKTTIESIEEKRENSKLRDLRINDAMYQDTFRKASSLAHVKIMETAKASPTGSVAVTKVQAYEMAQAAVDSMPAGSFPDGYRETLINNLATDIAAKADVMNTPGKDNQDAIDFAEELIRAGYSAAEVDRHLVQARKDGRISRPTYDTLYAKAQQEDGRVEVLPTYKADSQVGANDFGLDARDINSASIPAVTSMIGVAQKELKSRIDAGWAKIREMPPEDQAQAASDLITSVKREVVAKFKESNKALLDKADPRRNRTLFDDNPEIQKVNGNAVASLIGTFRLEESLENGTISSDRYEDAVIYVQDEMRKALFDHYKEAIHGGMDPDEALADLKTNAMRIQRKVKDKILDASPGTGVPASVQSAVPQDMLRNVGARAQLVAAPEELVSPEAAEQAAISGIAALSQVQAVLPGSSWGPPWAVSVRRRLAQVQDTSAKAEAAYGKIAQGDPSGMADLDQAKRDAYGAMQSAINEMLDSRQPVLSATDPTTGRIYYRISRLGRTDYTTAPGVVPVRTLKAERTGISKLVGTTPDGQLIYRPDNEATLAYRAIKASLGYSKDELDNGVTNEGVGLDVNTWKASMDPTRVPVVNNRADFDVLYKEYQDSNGTKGLLADIVRIHGAKIPDIDGFKERQYQLINRINPQ